MSSILHLSIDSSQKMRVSVKPLKLYLPLTSSLFQMYLVSNLELEQSPIRKVLSE